jgi:protein O-GlcNAc transferase
MSAEAYFYLGNAFQHKGQSDNAVTFYQKALQSNPNFAEAYNNMGIAFVDQDRKNEAITCYQKALQIKPDYSDSYSNIVDQLRQTCNWQELTSIAAKLDGFTRKALDNGTKPVESPFHNITRHAELSLNLAIAKSWSCEIDRDMSFLKTLFPFDGIRSDKQKKIVIGYLSNEFLDHATAHLMLSLFRLHNRDNFDIYCYSYGKDDGSSYRARIQHDCDRFVDIASLNYDTAARCIYDDHVDILVDLKGYTTGNRLAICALHPAPVQVSYLGFPGSTGADFLDYIITDKIVTPEDHAPYYTEHFVYMPHCYQVNDHNQSISNKYWKREDFRLPESCFVFCSFNQPYKINPLIFDGWMRILQQIPESVLWLLLMNRTAEENLRKEAEARGIKAERLIFADRLPKDEHLARLRFADLALDTQIVNGHTTTSDALWAGVPVITLQGCHFASRVSSSILSAIGFTELITHSLEEYEALAVKLARNPVELQEIRQRIANNRLVAPLFDTPRFVRNLETAYKEMWKIFLAGEAPKQIEVMES